MSISKILRLIQATSSFLFSWEWTEYFYSWKCLNTNLKYDQTINSASVLSWWSLTNAVGDLEVSLKVACVNNHGEIFAQAASDIFAKVVVALLFIFCPKLFWMPRRDSESLALNQVKAYTTFIQFPVIKDAVCFVFYKFIAINNLKNDDCSSIFLNRLVMFGDLV